MKKLVGKIVLLTIAVLLVATMTTTVKAAEVSVGFAASKTEVKAGDTFTVEVTAKCEDGLEGFDSVLKYDGSKLELTNAEEITEITGGMSEFINDQGGLKCFQLTRFFTSGTEKSVATLQFKVLESAAEGNTSIQLTDINVSDNPVANKSISIKIGEGETPEPSKTLTSIQIATPPTKIDYTEGDKFDKSGMKVLAVYDDGTTKEITSYTISPDGKLTKADTKVTISYTEGEVTKTVEQTITVKAKSSDGNTNTDKPKNNVNVTGDNTISSKDQLPKTGAAVVVVPMVIISMVAVGAFFKYKNMEI